ncbi:MAG TPA: hypothetical protein VFL64_19275 [Rhizobacter sp.]|nr:hypothetical protein [Rhizobacter sp.]
MNQPQAPVPPRAARPQLFSAPAAKQGSGRVKGHADFGPSILATIDGGQARMPGASDRLAIRRVLLMAGLSLIAAAVYLGVKFSAARAASPSHSTAVAATGPSALLRPVESAMPPASQAAVQGVAAIETVPAPIESAALPAANRPINEAVSTNTIQQALDRPEAVPGRNEEKVTSQSTKPTRTAAATHSPAKPAGKVARQSDTDAELLAAMLPHLRGTGAPSSPAFERRCGQLTGDALGSCRARFCNGRQGEDAACPASPESSR